jgi:trypsin
LQGVEVPIVEYQKCLQALEKGEKIPEDVVCAGFLEPGKDACQGDSGSPLAIEGVLVGLVSFGVGCGSSNYPGFYTNVADHIGWIKKNAGI